MLELNGIITNIVFRNDENGYTVARFDTDDGEITIVGHLPSAEENLGFNLKGYMVYHDKYGEQFKIETAHISMPKTETAIIRYLSSGVIPHIGKVTAKRIVDIFGEDTLEIIEEDPYKLKRVKGIGDKKIEKIKEAIEDQKNSRDTIIYLQSLGFGLSQASKIYLKYKEDTINRISEDPYQLIDDFRGIGFIIADRIALKNGLSQISEFRIFAGIKYILNLASINNGDCFLSFEELVEKSSDILNIDSSHVKRVLDIKVIEGRLIKDEIDGVDIIYNEYLYRAEDIVATRLMQLILTGISQFDIDIDRYKSKFEDLDSTQEEAVREVFKNKLCIITGGPGTGKTTIVKKIVEIAQENDLDIMLAAPTGRAAKRLEESTDMKASTIHRLLKYQKQDDGYLSFEHNSDNPIKSDILIIDEASMMDIELTQRLVEAVPISSSIVFVGDVDQLPSVGPGNVLKDIILSGFGKTIVLKTIYRQSKNSNIVLNAHKINNGQMPILNEEGNDFFFLECKNQKLISDTILDLVNRRLPQYYGFDPIKDIQVLSMMKKGELGVVELNRKLQKILNENANNIEYRDEIFKIGDKIMQSVNNYSLEYEDEYGNIQEGVFNGDMGIIEEVDKEENSLRVKFDDNRKSFYDKGNLDELILSYAITIHKSQGSEFKAVVLPIFQGPYLLLTRNILYTAITRAKSLVVLVGDLNILRKMIQNNTIAKRNSSLAYRMKVKEELFKGVL
ncbi:MAG: ATP-dependent RecD-like DNA helicase [Tissierellia bacterium]|nr:ATP-dependent RecD-like DNA helicase [Tissierellia bacterium]